jgi:NAD(P)-dependent dehydrogenase (short-subunit alcohol dehydrogenase family)
MVCTWAALIAAVAKHNIIVSGGSITLTSGAAGIHPGANASVGGALNGAVIALTRGLAIDLAPKRIRVNTVIPGLVDTELLDKNKPKGARKAILEKGSKNLLVEKVATPQDIAEAYIYLLRADYATGTSIVIDGGRLLST